MARQRKLPPGMQLRGTVYYSCFRAGGRQVRKRLSTDFDAACKILNHLRAKADKADFGMVDNNVALVELRTKFDQHCRLTLRPSTLKRYRESLNTILAGLPVMRVAQLSESVVNAYRESRLLKVSTRSVNIETTTLNTMLNWAAAKRNGFIASNPIADVKPLSMAGNERKRRRPLTSEEVETLFKVSPDYVRPVWRMFMTTGLRHAEVTNLRFSDVDFDHGTVMISAANAKTKRGREVPLDDEMLATIKRLRQEAPNREPGRASTPELTADIARRFSRDHVFVSRVGTPWRGVLLRKFYEFCAKAGIEGAEPGGSVDIHSLRVSFATLAIEHGANPTAVQAILGHSTLAMTMSVYSKATDRAKRAAVSALPFARATPPAHLIPLQNEHNVHATNSDTLQVVG